MTKAAMLKIANIQRRYRADVASAKRRIREANEILRNTENRQIAAQRLLESMSIVRNMSDLEIRKENLPGWCVGASPRIFCKGSREGLILPAFSNKLDEIFDKITAAKRRVYDTIGDGMVHYEHVLKPGHKRSEFRDDWYNPLARWEYQFHDRTLREDTYRMIMENSAEQVFERIKSGKINS